MPDNIENLSQNLDRGIQRPRESEHSHDLGTGSETPSRRHIVESAKLVVIKLGTRVVCKADGRLNADRVAAIAEEVSVMVQQGRRVVLVSSGAVGAGMSQLGLDQRPCDLAELQAVAAVGQARLMSEYQHHFSKHEQQTAQVLLTSDDLDDRARYLNVRNTLLQLLEMGAVPIVNENDTVAVDELLTTFGDNDRLAARVTNLLRAPLLIFLSDVDGLYDGNPDEPGSRVIPTVDRVDASIWEHVCDGSKSKAGEASSLSRGGMKSKLAAAQELTSSGEHVILANGHQQGLITRIMLGEPIGTLFCADAKSVSQRKRWIGFSARPKGSVHMDAGACHALQVKGGSLLPVGVQKVTGTFNKGDVVAMLDPKGQEIGRGLCNYSSEEVQRIKGAQSDQIEPLLGHCPYTELIHRDNLMLK